MARIASTKVSINATHTLMADLDVNLRSPGSNNNGLFNDIGSTATGGQTMMDLTLDQYSSGIPFIFTALRPVILKPELNYRLDWFDGENPSGLSRRVWEWKGATMTVGVGSPTENISESAGWGNYRADISDFAGKVIQITFHVDTDSSINFGGLAIDDVQLRNVGPTAASVNVSGRVTDSAGFGVPNAVVTMTDGFGTTTRHARLHSAVTASMRSRSDKTTHLQSRTGVINLYRRRFSSAMRSKMRTFWQILKIKKSRIF